MTLETSIKHAIKDYLTLKGIFWWYNLAGLGAQKGIPDLFALKDGTLYGLEVKTPQGVVSGHQEAFGEWLTKAGGIFLVVRSLDDVMAIL